MPEFQIKNPVVTFFVIVGIILFLWAGWKILFLVVIALVLSRGNGTIAQFINSLKSSSMANPIEVNVDRLSQGMGGVGKIIVRVVLVLLVVWVASWFVVIIDAGETGVYSLFGKVSETEISSGFHMVNPLAKITRMSIRTEQYTMSIVSNEGQKQGDDSISALTREGLDVSIDFTALYRLEESKASDIYREVGIDYVDKIIRPEIRGIIRDVISQYDAKELYSEKRQEASGRIFDALKEKVESRGIFVEEAVIRNVQLPASLTRAIQEKLSAEQEAQRYDFVLDREKKEADRKRIEAEGQRDAQKTINESLTPNYLNYLYINQLKDRQGTIYVPTNPATGMPVFKGL